ncbi:hypothetical protein, partial [Effusibacillus consociatus]|uniref:hypothetical protein n=1 Tax=Effusibacillus consociatus TaxID=1117041 RepID=UPI0036D3708A
TAHASHSVTDQDQLSLVHVPSLLIHQFDGQKEKPRKTSTILPKVNRTLDKMLAKVFRASLPKLDRLHCQQAIFHRKV